MTVTTSDITPPPPAPAPHRSLNDMEHQNDEVEAAIKDIRLTLQRTKVLPVKSNVIENCQENTISPVWVPRCVELDILLQAWAYHQTQACSIVINQLLDFFF